MTTSEGFQHNFTIILKFVSCGCYMKKNVAFTLISFAVIIWDDCLSVQVPFELLVEIPVELLLELEANWWTRIWKCKSICLFFMKINNEKKMLHRNQAPGIMLENGHQILQLLGH